MRTSTPGRGTPTEPKVPSAVAHWRGGDRAELRHPVATEDFRPRKTCPEPSQGRCGNRRAPDSDHGQAREVGRGEPGGADESSTMAGTRKAAIGRSRSTEATQASALKWGRNHPLSPLRNGPATSRDPLVVAKGEAERKPRPSQAEGTRSVVESPPWRTTTPFGRPVVPDVNMMSATSSGPNAGSRSWSSGESRSAHRIPASRRRCTPPSRRRPGLRRTTSLQKTADAPASRRIRASSPGPRRARSGTATAPGLVDGQIRHQPFQRLLVADEQSDPVTAAESPVLKAPGQTIRAAVPVVQGELGAVCQIAPRHTIGERVGQQGDEIWLEQRHAAVGASLHQYGAPPSRIERGLSTSMVVMSTSLTPRARMTGSTSSEM